MEYLTQDPISLDEWHRQTIDARDGASVEFLGMVRGDEEGHKVQYLDYEAYIPMAEQVITALIEEAKRRWPLHKIFVRHRIGRVAVGEVSVIVGVQSPHREEAFEACRFLIDSIKKDVPVWKKPYVNRTDISRKESLVPRV